jgi:tripartite ATP-independent transporter DctM subunit
MSVELITVLLIFFLLVLLALGLPMSFSLGGIAIIFALGVWGPKGLLVAASTAYSIGTEEVLLCIPMFIFLGSMLQCGGLADDLYGGIQRILGSLHGGLAITTVIICTIFAALAGISAVATVTMGLIALPAMLSRGYEKKLAMGSIAGGGALGILIPPSVPMVLYALLANESVGKLFAGGVIPGLILSSVFVSYILIMSYRHPNFAPPLPPELRINFIEKLRSLKTMIYPAILIFLVLGTIWLGIATPTEGAGIGALGSVVVVILQRRFRWKTFFDACEQSVRLTAMGIWIAIGSSCFSSVFNAAGSQEMVSELIIALPGGRWAIYFLFQFIYFILGMFMDPTGIVFITTPIFVPVIKSLGFDPVWFGITFILNMEMAYLTPPFGLNLFYLRSIVSEQTATTAEIWLACIPFISMQVSLLLLVTLFPQIVLWFPNLII